MRTMILAAAAAALLSLSGGAFAANDAANSTANQNAMSGTSDRNTIMQVQQKLKSDGTYNGKVDGVDSAEMQAALKQYQQKNGLEATGRLDQKTEKKLGISESSGSTTPPASSSGSGMSGPEKSNSMGSGSQK
jgi:peptidoglycan hydrolase-like protein with peptidoglycan-binding domain